MPKNSVSKLSYDEHYPNWVPKDKPKTNITILPSRNSQRIQKDN